MVVDGAIMDFQLLDSSHNLNIESKIADIAVF